MEETSDYDNESAFEEDNSLVVFQEDVNTVMEEMQEVECQLSECRSYTAILT